MADTITKAIDALTSAAFIEGGVSIERTDEARERTEQRKRELIEAIAACHPQAVAAQAAPAAVAVPPSAYVNAAGITASDKPGTVVRKLDSAFHDAVTFKDATPALPATEDSSAGDLAEGPDGFGSAEHWKEKAQYWAGVAHELRGQALRGEPVDGIIQPTSQAEVQAEPVANCYSDDDGDTWRDCPDDSDFVEGRQLGEEFELQASIRSWSETFRVTKVPDETSDDYEVEPVSVRTAPQAQPADARLQHQRDSAELRNLCVARDHARRERDLCKAEIAGLQSSCANLGRLVDELRPNAERYDFLREQDLDAIKIGGVFAGKTPDNVVLNGDDLDAAIDAAMAAAQEGGNAAKEA